jgi:gliding motility-associated-like protein
MKKITILLFALLISFVGYSQFPTPGTEGFENTTGPDVPIATSLSSPWSLGTGATGNQWAVFDVAPATATQVRWDRTAAVTTPPSFYSGAQAAFINRRQLGAALLTSEDYLATPLITVPASGQLTFWTRKGFNANGTGAAATADVNYLIKVNTNTTAGSQTTPANYTATLQTWNNANPLVAIFNIYELKTVDLSAYAGQQVYLAFVKVFTQPTAALSGNSWYVDDVKIVQQCIAPVSTSLSATGITTTSANLSWGATTATSWEIEIVNTTAGGLPTGVGTVYNGALPYNATGLLPATGYAYYVRSKCTDSDSAWVGPFNFITLTPGLTCPTAIIIPPTLPYTTTDTTANYSDTTDATQPAACAGTATNFMAGNDVFYTYTAATTGAISITMTPGATNSGIFVYQGCANVGVTCLAGVANTTNGIRDIPSLNVTAGQTYIIVLSSSAATQNYPYSLLIQQLNCPPPTALGVSAITPTGANLSWTSPATYTSWQYIVQPAGSPIPTVAGTTTNSSTATTASGLTPDTAYQYWVRADCDGAGTTFSPWTGPFPFTTAVADPVCGGLFVDAGGQAGNYPNNSNITYPICPTNAGDQVTVTFTAFNTQLSTDLLKVYNGNGTTGALLGTYSGTTIPGPITSSTPDGCLTFVFTSNATTQAAGWVANVTCSPAPPCQKPILVTTPAVLFNSVQLVWTQPTNPDGSSVTAWEYIVVPCGTAAPNATTAGTSITTYPFTVTGLSPLTCYDFYIRSICATNSEWVGPTTANTPLAPPICGGNFADSGGIAGNYINNANATTPICPTGAPGQQVTVSFISFNTELTNDVLKVYSGSGTGGPLLGTYSGTTLPPSITSAALNGCLTFVFTSNANTTSEGWLANVTCAPAPPCQKPILLNAPSATVLYNSVKLAWTQPLNPNSTLATSWEVIALPCGSPAPTATSTGVITGGPTNFVVTGLMPLTCYDFYVRAVCSSTSSSSWTGPTTATTPIAPPICGGNFVDPGGLAGAYANNVTATTGTTIIQPVTPGDYVTVTFISFNTELNNDLLKVYSGNGTGGILLGTYSGTTIPPAITSASPDGYLTFVFTSNGTTTAAGWLANVTCAPAPACQKPVVLTAPSATVLYNSVQLDWIQPANIDTTVANAWEVIALPCGSPVPSATATGVIAAGPTNFVVTGLTPLTCYDFYVRAVCSPTSSSIWAGPVTATTPIAPPICGGNFVDPGGLTGNYANNTTAATAGATTTICPTNPGDQVTVTFTAFNTELNNDLLKVYSGTGTTGPLLATYSGSTIPPAVTSASADGCLTFVFTSNGTTPGAGWLANVTCAPAPACQKPVVITAPSIQSTTVTLNWIQPANPNTTVPSAWQVIALPCGSPAPSATVTTGVISASTSTFTVTGLTLSTCYDFYVRAACDATTFSSWSGPKTVTTTPCDNACNYTFTVSDTFGDGWNGNTMSVIQNGVTVATLTGPTDAENTTPIPVSVTLCPGVFQLFWNAGGAFATEVGVKITSFLGDVIFTHTPGTNLQNTLLFSDTTICTPPTCPKPTAISAGSTSNTTAAVGWTENGTATQWEIIYLPQGSPAPGPGSTGIIVNTNPATITGLAFGTFYDVYVRAICSSTDISIWSSGTALYINPPLPSCAGVTLNLTTTSPGVLDVCPDDNCVNLTASYTDSKDTTSYSVFSTTYAPPFPFTGGTQVSVDTDDVWSGDLTIPFKFCFYGVPYTSLNIGSNGVVTFNTHAADSNCPWAFTAQIPDTNFPILNAIYAPYQDINPGVTTAPAQPNINYQVLGLAPCRVFVINFSNVAQFSCGVNVGLQTSQLVLYETSNAIDIYIKDRTPCTTWNSGSGVIGIQNATGTNAVVPPGRNTGTWPATNEAWRFLPTGNSNVTFQWLQDGAPLTSNLSTNVCVTNDTNLTAKATYTACDGTFVVKEENILLNLITPVTPTFAPVGPLCQGDTAPLLPNTSTNTTGITGVWSPATINTSVAGNSTYTFTPNAGQCAVPTTLNVTVNSSVTTLFNTPAPICFGSTAPILPTSSINTPAAITGSWTPNIVSNTATGTYTFNPDPGQCATPSSVQVTVNYCAPGTFASAVWLTNCATSNFFNTDGSGANLIGPASNVFSNTNFGIYVQNSNNLILRGAEIKTFKTPSSNFCSARLNYRVYPATTTPGAFQVMDLPLFDNCSGGTFPTGGPCNTGDQKWQRVVPNGTTNPYSPVDLTAYPPGNYVLQVYYDLTGSDTTATGCEQNYVVDNSGSYYTATFTIQAQPSYASANPSICGGVNGSITISGMLPSTSYGVTYLQGSTTVGPVSLTSNSSGQIIIGGLNAGTYSNFAVELNSCVYTYTTPIVLVQPSIPTVTVNSPTECGVNATVTATPGSAGTYSYVWTVPAGVTNPGNVNTFVATDSGDYSVFITNTVTGCTSTSASGTVTFNAIPTVTVTSPTNCGVNATVTATPGSSGTYTYTWTVPSGTNPGNVASFNATVSGAYTVTVTNAAGCISLAENSTVTINPNPTVSVNSPTACNTSNVTVTATPGVAGTYNYVWTVPTGVTNPGNVDNFVASVSGNYSVEITDAVTGCTSNSASGTVTISSTPTVSVTSPTTCGLNATVTALPGSPGTYTYTWTVPSGTNPGNVATFNATASGAYTVTVTNAAGCTSLAANSTVTINPNPTVTVSSPVVCNGQSATITATPGSAGTYSYAWTVPSGVTNPGNVASFNLVAAVAGTYSVIITNTTTSCFSLSSSGTISFAPAFDYTLFGECLDNNFTLEVIPSGSSLDLNTSTFNWTVNSVSVGSNATFNATAYFNDPMVTTQLPATFNVNVTTVDGCQLSDSIVVDRIYCELQKGISPNNDNKNDFFDLRLMNVQKLGIYNRLGANVYSKNEYTNEWIGQSDSGSELPDGTYYYVIEFKNNQPSKTGWIYINRNSK